MLTSMEKLCPRCFKFIFKKNFKNHLKKHCPVKKIKRGIEKIFIIDIVVLIKKYLELLTLEPVTITFKLQYYFEI